MGKNNSQFNIHNSSFANNFEEVLIVIQKTKQQVFRQVNSSLIALYWEVALLGSWKIYFSKNTREYLG